MTTYTDCNGARFVLCDHCRCNIPLESQVFTLNPSVVKEGYTARDYEKGELVLCNDCTLAVGQVLNFMSVKQAHHIMLLQNPA